MSPHGTLSHFSEQNRYPDIVEVLLGASLYRGSLIDDLTETCRLIQLLQLDYGSQKALGFARDLAGAIVEQPQLDMIRRLRDALATADVMSTRPLQLRLSAHRALCGDGREQEFLAGHCQRQAHLQPRNFLSYTISAHGWLYLSMLPDSQRAERLAGDVITDDVPAIYTGRFRTGCTEFGERMREQIGMCSDEQIFR